MPTINFSLKDLEKLSEQKITPAQLVELAHYAKGELEHYDKKTDEALISLDDSNLPYLWSVEGIARLYRGLLKKQRGIPKIQINKSDFVIKVDTRVAQVRPYITSFVAKGPPLNEYALKQLIQLQEKFCESYGRKREKVSIGIYTPRHITWPVHYTVTLPEDNAFVPLQGTHKMSPKTILKQHSKGREYGHLLEGKKLYPLLRDASSTVLSLPPIINSDTAGKIEVGEKEFLFEATGGDERALHLAAAIFAQALYERGYTIFEVTLEHNNKKTKTPVLHKQQIQLKKEAVENLLGLTLKEKDIQELVERAGYDYRKGIVQIPPYRDDIMHNVDVIEDIAIMYGFQNIKPLALSDYTVGSPLPHIDFYDTLRELIVGLGYQEIFSQILTNKELLYKKMNTKEVDTVEISNYSSKNYTVMRTWLLPLLLEVLSKSKHADYPQLVFEQGTVVLRKKKHLEEKEKLALVIAKSDATFSDAKQALEAVLRVFNTKIILKETQHSSFIDGRCANILVKRKSIGIIGELHPAVMNNFGIEMPVVAFELDVECLNELIK